MWLIYSLRDIQVLGRVRRHGCSVLRARPRNPRQDVHELPGTGQLPVQWRSVMHTYRTHLTHITSFLLTQANILVFFLSNQATTIGWSTPTMTTTPSPTPAAPWRRTAAARTATPSSSPGTPVACHQPSSASSVRSRRTSAWPESSSPSCSPEPAKEKEGVKRAERERTESVRVRVMMCRMNGWMQRVKKKKKRLRRGKTLDDRETFVHPLFVQWKCPCSCGV